MPVNRFHEIRDPIHNFIRLDSDERRVIDSLPFQRLRHIHQLALTYLVYPGATHRRFEHSLGVMELAGRVYDVVTKSRHLHQAVGEFVPGEGSDEHRYWRRVVRMAALCHDIGHLPFSHAAEDLLPDGWNHERLTVELIRSDYMRPIWSAMRPPLNVDDVVKLAVGRRKAKDQQFTNWEAILSEIIVGDAFGVDRMDYLLRDSHHAGVAYGVFDQHRLIDTLRILPRQDRDTEEPELGLEDGGLHAAEALMMARYFMYTQVYFHHVRRAYDIHLRDFLHDWLPEGKFSVMLERHLQMTDAEVMAAISDAARDTTARSHLPASHIVGRGHYKLFYQRNPADQAVAPDAAERIFAAARDEFGADHFRYDRYTQKAVPIDFPVLQSDQRIVSSLSCSDLLAKIPIVAVEYVFVDSSVKDAANRWLNANRTRIIGEGGTAA